MLMTHQPMLKRTEIKANLARGLDSLESVIESKLYHLREQIKALKND